MRPGMWSMVTLSFDSSLYAAFFPALSGKTAGSPAPGPVRHFRPMATILSRTRPSGWGGRGYSRCARSALSSACSATGRSGSRQRVPRHFPSRGSSHTRRRGRTSRRLARGAAVAAPPAGGPVATAVMPRAGAGAGHHRAHPVALPPVFGHAPGGKGRRRRRETVHPHTGKRWEAVVADGHWQVFGAGVRGPADGPVTRPPGSSPPPRDRGRPACRGRTTRSSTAAGHPAGAPGPAGGGRPSSPPGAAGPRRRTPAGTDRAERRQRTFHRHVGEVRRRHSALPPGNRRRPCRRQARTEPLRNPPDRPETGGKNRFAPGVPPILALDRLQRRRTAAAVRLPAHRALGHSTVPALIWRRPTCIGRTQGIRATTTTVDLRSCEKNPAGAVMRKNPAGTNVQTGKPAAFGVRCPDRSGHG